MGHAEEVATIHPARITACTCSVSYRAFAFLGNLDSASPRAPDARARMFPRQRSHWRQPDRRCIRWKRREAASHRPHAGGMFHPAGRAACLIAAATRYVSFRSRAPSSMPYRGAVHEQVRCVNIRVSSRVCIPRCRTAARTGISTMAYRFPVRWTCSRTGCQYPGRQPGDEGLRMTLQGRASSSIGIR